MKEQFKSIHGNEFSTPEWLFKAINREFNFTVDLACTELNNKCPVGLYDSLEKPWHEFEGWLWLNPPYSPLKPWIQKAQKEFLLGAKIVVLCPPIVSTRYFSDVPPAQIRFIKGRVPFVINGQEMRANTHDSCLLIYGPPVKPDIVYVERDDYKKEINVV